MMCGQSADWKTTGQSVLNFNKSTYNSIVANKAVHYTFIMPTFLGMTLAEVRDPKLFQQIYEILFDIGFCFQIEDDFLDCFGDPEVTGKIGNDINEGKCTWLAMQFLEMANQAQKEQFLEVYGRNNTEDVERVKQLYEDVNLRKIFIQFESDAHREIMEKIDQVESNATKEFLRGLLGSTLRRRN